MELEARRATALERLGEVECVLFDLDGTLIDSIELILSSFRYATGVVLGTPLTDADFLRDMGKPLAEQMRAFAPDRVDELVLAYREHNDSVHDSMLAEYEGVCETVDALEAAGVIMGVVTSKRRSGALRGLERVGLGGRFPVIIAADDVERHKPDPLPLLKASRALGVDIARCAYLGDSPHDMSSAIAAGAVSVAALWGAFDAPVVLAPGPDFAVNDIRQVPALFDGGAERYLVEIDVNG